jgi:hypothetical protein
VNGFSHLSLLIDLDDEKWWPAPAAFLDPKNYFPKRSRRLLHESLHYWQQLSQGYLFLLAEEDWTAFLTVLGGGAPPADSPRRRHFKEAEGRHGLSAWSISESLTQFWEVLIAGDERAPGKQWASDADLDAAMLASRDYSEPFRLARRLLDPDSSLVVFPLLAHFALKTSRPAFFFERFIETIAAKLGAKAKELGVLDPHSGPNAGVLYPFAEAWAEEHVRAAGEPGLLHAPELFARSLLREHPGYVWSFERRARLEARVRGGMKFDVAICLPLPSHRRILAEDLTPPCVRFGNGEFLTLAHHYLKQSKNAAPAELEAAQKAAAACAAVQTKADELLRAARGY